MFLRRYQRTKQGKTHTYYALVESVRTDAGPRQRIVAHLGELNHDQERRWHRTLDQLLNAQDPIENALKERLGSLFQLDYDLLLYDLTSTYFEGLAEDNDLAKRGYSRDHRSDCKQVVIALVLSREGFPLAHRTWAGNTQDLQTVKKIVTDIEARFGKSNRVWVMDRGMISKDALAFLSQPGRRYLLSTRRAALAKFQSSLETRRGWT